MRTGVSPRRIATKNLWNYQSCIPHTMFSCFPLKQLAFTSCFCFCFFCICFTLLLFALLHNIKLQQENSVRNFTQRLFAYAKRLFDNWTVKQPILFLLERRWSSRTFRYGYLVTTSPQSSAPPSAAPSLRLGHWLRAYPTPMVWRAVCTRPGNVFTATFWFAITSDSSFM